MANQNLNINIGTSFNGQGMSKAMTAVDGLSKTAGKVAGAVGRLGSEFESLGGTAGKSIGAISGALGALASGGIFGAIIFGITSLIQLFQKMGEDNSMEKLKDTLSKVKENSENVVTSMNGSLGKIDRYASSIDRLAAAYQRLAKAEAQAKTSSLYEGIEDMEEGSNKIVAQGSADLQAARIEANTSNSVATARVTAADNKVSSINSKIQLVSDTIDLLKEDLTKYDKAVIDADSKLYARRTNRFTSKSEIEEAQEQLKLATKARNEFVTKTLNPAIQQKNELQNTLKTAQVERQAAEAERLNVEKENAKKLEIAERAYRGSLAEATDVKEREIAEEEQLVAEQKAQAYRWARLQELEKEVETTTKAVKDAQDDYAKALRNASNAANAAAIIADGGVWNPNGAKQGRDRGAEGPASNNEDWGGSIFSHAKGKSARYWQTHQAEAAAKGVNAGMSQKEQREYNELAGKWASGQDLTASQRKRLRELAEKDPEQQKLKAEKEAEKAKDKLTDAQETAQNTKDIYNLLKNNLGLK